MEINSSVIQKKIEDGEYTCVREGSDDLMGREITNRVVIINKEWLDTQENPIKMINSLTNNGTLKHMIV